MYEWRDLKTDPPPEGVLVEVLGTDCFGEWIVRAKRKDYQPGSTKAQLKRGWRWVLEDGDSMRKGLPDVWRSIS